MKRGAFQRPPPLRTRVFSALAMANFTRRPQSLADTEPQPCEATIEATPSSSASWALRAELISFAISPSLPPNDTPRMYGVNDRYSVSLMRKSQGFPIWEEKSPS